MSSPEETSESKLRFSDTTLFFALFGHESSTLSDYIAE